MVKFLFSLYISMNVHRFPHEQMLERDACTTLILSLSPSLSLCTPLIAFTTLHSPQAYLYILTVTVISQQRAMSYIYCKVTKRVSTPQQTGEHRCLLSHGIFHHHGIFPSHGIFLNHGIFLTFIHILKS